MQNILKILLGSRIGIRPHRSVGRPRLFQWERVIYFIFLNYLLTTTPSFAKNETPVSKIEVDSVKRNEAKYWYADKPMTEKKEEKKVENKPKSSTQSKIDKQTIDSIATFFKIVVWIILGAAVVGAIYVIVRNLNDFRFRKNTKISTQIEDISQEIDIKELDISGFGSQIDKCIKDKNYRLAVRYYYLWVIKNLDETNLIAFNIDKTNQDYSRELNKKPVFSKQNLSHFKQCTTYYEYLWFGNFTVSDSAFFSIENTFKDFINRKA